MSPSLYFHTARFLRARQIAAQIQFRLFKPTPDCAPASPRRAPAAWIEPARKAQSLVGPKRFRFLNAERELTSPADWNRADWPKLWLYNLHYFDDLNAIESESRKIWHRALMLTWIEQNAPGSGNGWEPYTLSLRIVNWIKWCLGGNVLPAQALQSLSVQTRYLARRLEFHLLGNHLWANAKALVFAGLFFEGGEAAAWLARGLRIIEEQLDEQVLADGGHFERSPMYHNIVLEDLLDLINLLRTFPVCGDRSRLDAHWTACAGSMLRWMNAMTQPDGEIALLNDSALGVASTAQALNAYAARLGVSHSQAAGALIDLAQTGYVVIRTAPAWMVLDVAPIGPDYLPGHAHADTLSFELSVNGRRVVVDSGTSTYEASTERVRQRSTRAHNTVEIDGRSSSEVWSSFRVARRAYPRGLEVLHVDDMIRVRCSHDGYTRLQGRPMHRREWTVTPGTMVVSDAIDGPCGRAVARFHFHPQCALSERGERAGRVTLAGQSVLEWLVERGRVAITDSTYHPEFGLTTASKCLEVELDSAHSRTRFSWTT